MCLESAWGRTARMAQAAAQPALPYSSDAACRSEGEGFPEASPSMRSSSDQYPKRWERGA